MKDLAVVDLRAVSDSELVPFFHKEFSWTFRATATFTYIVIEPS